MTERFAHGQRREPGPRPVTLSERGQLFRRSRYAIHEMPGLHQPVRDSILHLLTAAAHDSALLPDLRVLLADAGVPEVLPRNAASPARIAPRRP